MNEPVRIQLSRTRGFNLQAASLALNGLPAVNCARPALWSNPFIIGDSSGHSFHDDGDPTPLIASVDRAMAIEMFETMVHGIILPEMHPYGHRWMERFKAMHGAHPMEAVADLRGHNLACWCKPGDACHCDVLLDLANPDWRRSL